MENSVLVQVNERLQDLVQEGLGLVLGQRLVPVLLHVLLQVELQVLEHQVELVLRIDDLLQPIMATKLVRRFFLLLTRRHSGA